MEDFTNGCLDWDSTIENDGQEFITLEEGDYNFTVSSFERSRFPGSEKIPACNKAVLTLAVESPRGTASCKLDLILYASLEWKLAAFFRCIGQKKHGEKLVMNWANVPGAKGRAHFKPDTYVGRDGKEKTKNELTAFIDYDEKNFSASKKEEFSSWKDAPTGDLPF